MKKKIQCNGGLQKMKSLPLDFSWTWTLLQEKSKDRNKFYFKWRFLLLCCSSVIAPQLVRLPTSRALMSFLLLIAIIAFTLKWHNHNLTMLSPSTLCKPPIINVCAIYLKTWLAKFILGATLLGSVGLNQRWIWPHTSCQHNLLKLINLRLWFHSFFHNKKCF